MTDLRTEVADLMTGGGCDHEHWPEALEKADEIIQLIQSTSEDDTCVAIYRNTNQGKKIQYLKLKGGRVLSCFVKIEMPNKSIVSVDDWGRVEWLEEKR